MMSQDVILENKMPQRLRVTEIQDSPVRPTSTGKLSTMKGEQNLVIKNLEDSQCIEPSTAFAQPQKSVIGSKQDLQRVAQSLALL